MEQPGVAYGDGGIILLSPGAPSFDEFPSYRERGARLRSHHGSTDRPLADEERDVDTRGPVEPGEVARDGVPVERDRRAAVEAGALGARMNLALVPPDRVAAATVKAIESNKAEIIVATGITKVVDVFHALSPALTTNIARKSGAYRFMASAKESSFHD